MQIDLLKSPASDRLRIAESIDIGVIVTRYARENDVSLGHAQDVARETVRYLALFAANSKPYGIGGEIDKFWHTFILFTQRYADFCDQVAGRFIHHSPMEDLSESQAGQSVSPVEDYRSAYGVAPNPAIWFGIATQAVCIGKDCVPRAATESQAVCIGKDCVPRATTESKAACIGKDCVPRAAAAHEASCIGKDCMPRAATATSSQANCITKDCMPRDAVGALLASAQTASAAGVTRRSN